MYSSLGHSFLIKARQGCVCGTRQGAVWHVTDATSWIQSPGLNPEPFIKSNQTRSECASPSPPPHGIPIAAVHQQQGNFHCWPAATILCEAGGDGHHSQRDAPSQIGHACSGQSPGCDLLDRGYKIPSASHRTLQFKRGNKWNESGFRPPLCTYRLNWARRTSWGWWDDCDDTVLQTQDSKFEPWRSEAEHATSRSRRLPTILTFTRGWGRNIFVSFKRRDREPNPELWRKRQRC